MDKKTTAGAEFFEKLINERGDSLQFFGMAILQKSHLETPPPLLRMLTIPADKISDIARLTIEALESHEAVNEDWIKFKWRVWAFVELQDIFDMPIYDDVVSMGYFKLWYFYFESKFALFESILAGANGFYLSSESILRPFLEFNVIQNYYYLRSKKSSSYFDLNNCLKTGRNPRWSKTIAGALPKMQFTDSIKNRIEAHYKSLSNKSSHPYHQQFSPKITNNSSMPGHSIIGVLSFWRQIDFVLESVLWMYYVNFPMLFQSKHIISKFGFNGPMGIFIDKTQEPIFKKSLREKDLTLFQKYSDENEAVHSLIEWFEGHVDLSTEEIVSTWNSEEDGKMNDDFEVAQTLRSAKIRALREAMCLDNSKNKEDELDISKLDFSLSGWSKTFKSKTRK